jgi:hypothetical protein
MKSIAAARSLVIRCAFLLAAIGVPLQVGAQDRLGGHFGALFPLVSHVGGETTTIGDDFTIGFPTGMTVKMNDRWAFDLELVPSIQNDALLASLTCPGILRSCRTRCRRLAHGLRRQPAVVGFTPLLNHAGSRPCHVFHQGVVRSGFRRTAAARTSVGLGSPRRRLLGQSSNQVIG